MNNFGKKSTFGKKWTPEISPVAFPDSYEKSNVVKKGQQIVYNVYQGKAKSLLLVKNGLLK